MLLLRFADYLKIKTDRFDIFFIGLHVIKGIGECHAYSFNNFKMANGDFFHMPDYFFDSKNMVY